MSGIPIYQLVFSTHAIKRMFERGISRTEVRHVLVTGKVIKEYPQDVPYPSQLVLGWSGNRASIARTCSDQCADPENIYCNGI